MLGKPPRVKAFLPQPADGQTVVACEQLLRWRPGALAEGHDVYIGTDANAVAEATRDNPLDVLVAQDHDDIVYDKGLLDYGVTYYWRIDEINSQDSNSPWKGDVWSFTVVAYLIVDDMEKYVDEEPRSDRIGVSWSDQWDYTGEDWTTVIRPGNGTNMTVGVDTEPYGPERTIVHNGTQSLPLTYDNSYGVYYSETDRTFDEPQDWTQDSGQTLNTLGIHVRGRWDANNGFDINDSTYTVVGSGADIYNTSDEFHYVYMPLPGDGSIEVRVDSMDNTHVWAKAGVMIRRTLDPDAAHVCLDVTPDNLVELTTREFAGNATVGDATEADSITLPHWLRLTYQGDILTAEHSADRQTWNPVGDDSTLYLPMVNAYVGLAVTSHVDANTPCTAVFLNVEVTGTASETFTTSADIGLPINDPADLYVAIEDATGAVQAVYPHENNPNAVLVNDWIEWLIPLTAFSDQIDLTQVKKMIIGVGDKQPGGKGKLYIDDIRLYFE